MRNWRLWQRGQVWTLAASVVLALGLATTAVVLSAVAGYLGHAAPYPRPNRLMLITEDSPLAGPLRGSIGASARAISAWGAPRCLAQPVAWARPLGAGVAVTGAGATPATVVRLSAGLLQLLGVELPAGTLRSGSRWVVVSHGFWKRELHSPKRVVGRPIALQSRLFKIAAVLPAGFVYPGDLQLGIDAGAAGSARTDILELGRLQLPPTGVHGDFGFLAFGRLRPGCSPSLLARELEPAEQTLSRQYPLFAPLTADVRPVSDVLLAHARPELLELSASALALFATIAFGFWAFALMRVNQAEHQLRLRATLGASPTQLAGAAGAAVAPLALTGALSGMGLAALWARLRPLRIGELATSLNGPDAAVRTAAVLALVVLLPVTASVLSVALAARSGIALRAVPRRGRFPTGARLMLSAQAALAALFLAAALLLLATLHRMQRVVPGFRAAGVDYVEILAAADPVATFARLLSTLRATPGVTAAALASALPLTGEGQVTPLTNDLGHRDVAYRAVSGAYFSVVGIKVIHGATFAPNSRNQVLLSAIAARSLWPGSDPVGKELHVGTADDPRSTVAGVVGDVNQRGLRPAPEATAYVSFWAAPTRRAFLLVRSPLPLPALVRLCRRAARADSPSLAVADYGTLQGQVRKATAPRRRLLNLMASADALGIAACLLCLFAQMRAWAEAHARDLAIRVALGAGPAHLRALTLRRGLAPILWGLGTAATLSPALGNLIGPSIWVTPSVAIGCCVATAALMLLLGGWVALASSGQARRGEPPAQLLKGAALS